MGNRFDTLSKNNQAEIFFQIPFILILDRYLQWRLIVRNEVMKYNFKHLLVAIEAIKLQQCIDLNK